MAAVLDQITIATLGMYPDLNNELLSRDCALLRLLQENQVEDEGDPINISIRYKRNNGGSYSGYDQFDTAHVDQLAQGTLQWKFVYVNVTIDEATLVRNAGLNIRNLLSVEKVEDLPTPSRKAVFNIFGNEFKQSLNDMQDQLATMIYSDGTGNGGKDITGVVLAIDSTDDYAGIDVSADLGTFDYNGILSGSQDRLWASKEADKSSASIDLDMLADLLDDCAVGGHSPHWVFVPRDLYSSISLQLEGQKVRESAEASQIGFRNAIEWVDYGTTFYRDEYCTANTVYAVNKEFCKLYVNPALNMDFSGLQEAA